tara:strand:- start:4754 stop:5761 length:1008 start_codon:yes stop_codon:yes gene_type:complete
MKYIVCEKPGKFSMREKTVPQRDQNEALLKVNKVGICGTDIHAFAGNQPFFSYPRILGHELSCTVLEIGENEKKISNGDNVIVVPYISCKNCIACNNGKTNCCTNISVLGVHKDGGMQEKISVPVDILLPAKDLTFNQMAIVEPLSIGAHAIKRANVKPNDFVAVIGCGPIGIGIMKLSQIIGAKVIAIDTNEDRLNFVREKIGVDFVVKAGKNSLENVSKITNGDLCYTVFDATGNKFALESGPDYMSHGGNFVLVGLFNGELTYTHPSVHAKEMSLMCSRNATLADFEYVISIIHKFPTESFITHDVSFNDMIINFEEWINPDSGVIKATVSF